MKTALVIVNGIEFPFVLADHAIAWAKQEEGHLHVLFLVSGKEMPEGYAFPSDIDLAKTLNDKEDAENDSLKIIHSQMKLFKNMVERENIACKVELLIDPAVEQVVRKAKQATLLFIAPEYGDVALQAITDFSMQELIDQSPCPVEIVTGEAGSDD
jgi:hypothetical protein